MGASIFFTATMIRVFRSARSRGNGGTYQKISTEIAGKDITSEPRRRLGDKSFMDLKQSEKRV
jgi:hypothetical protein